MKFLLRGVSVRQKTIAAVTTLIIVFLGIILISLVSFSTTQQKLKLVTEQYQPKMLSAMHLTTHFYHSLSVLGNYLIEKDSYNLQMYNAKVADIDLALNDLVRLTDENKQLEDGLQLQRIKGLVNEIKGYNKSMLALAQNVSKNIPALGIAENTLEPLGVNMHNVINDLLFSVENDAQAELVYLVDILRYNWIMLVSEERNYLAFRRKQTIDEIALFNIGVDQSLDILKQHRGQFDEDQNDLLDEFEHYLGTYRDNQKVAIGIHTGVNWREDRQLMHNNISPTLRALTEELDLLVSKQQRRIKQSNQELSEQISTVEDTILFSIYAALFITLFVVALTLRNQRLTKDLRKHRYNEKLMRHKAHHDSLTGLPNRTFFNEYLFELFMNRKEESFALLFIDLDGFKDVNDTAGHDAGDYILVETAKRLTRIVRESDTVVRLGGDEFTVVLEHIDNSKGIAEKIAKTICEKVSENFIFKGTVLNITASIGLTYSKHPKLNIHDNTTHNIETMMKQADDAMYMAKNSGKNNYASFE